VIVLDAASGVYKRHWGAYGKAPSDEKLPMYNPQSPQFANTGALRAPLERRPGLRLRPRQQPRAGVQEGRNFVKQSRSRRNRSARAPPSTLVFSNDAQQKYFYLADGTNDQVLTVERESGRVVNSFGRRALRPVSSWCCTTSAIDSKGNLYTSEVGSGKRAQNSGRRIDRRHVRLTSKHKTADRADHGEPERVCSMWTQTLAGRSAVVQGPIFALRKSSAPLLLDWMTLLAMTRPDPGHHEEATAVRRARMQYG